MSSNRRDASPPLLAGNAQDEATCQHAEAVLAEISREIRAPMSKLLGMLELIGLGQLDAEQHDSLHIALDAARQVLGRVDNVLDYKRLEADSLPLVLSPTPVAILLRQVHAMFLPQAQAKGLSFTLEIAPQLAASLRVDGQRLRQILQNLVSNAIKFTQEGRICLQAQVWAQQQMMQILTFEVTDTGCGIANEQQAQLFRPFLLNSAQHSGLGLAISQRLARLMGGEIRLESEAGQGCCAILQLRAEIAPAILHLGHPGTQAGSELLPILFAEDHPINLKLTRYQLEKLGYPVVTARDGAEAFAKWQCGKFSLLLTDCDMPQMDGYQLAREIRAMEAADPLRGHIPIVACTANASGEGLQKTRAAGMDDFLAKPVDINTLSAVLDKWLQAVTANRASLEEAAVLERGVLREISGGEWALETDLLHRFLQDKLHDLAQLQQACRQDDAEEVRMLAHRIKGASRTVGALALAQTAAQMEQAASKGLRQQWPELQLQLEARLDAFAHYLQQEDRRQSSPGP